MTFSPKLFFQSLLMRSRIRLILCDNEAAFQDASEAQNGLGLSDANYPKALSLQADALFQMGKFEHALVIYHRGSRFVTSGFSYENSKHELSRDDKCHLIAALY